MTLAARRTLAIAALALAMVAGAASFGPAARAAVDSSPHTDAVATDRQAYVSDTPVDPYNKDALNLHVGAAGGSELARSFVHLALDALPAGASVSGATITVVPTTDQTQNVNPSAAIVQACVLTKELPAQFNSANPPPYDCSKGSAVGKAAPDGSWSFDLAQLVSFWAQAGNTGAAIVPVADPSVTWTLAFDKAQTAAKTTWTAPARPAGSTGAAAPQPAAAPSPIPAGSGGAVSGVSSVPYVVGAAPASPPAAGPSASAATEPAVAAPASPRGSSGGGVRTVAGHRSGAWIWVLLGSLVAAALLAGQPVAAAVTAGAGKVGATLVSQFRSHARAMTTSAVVLVWTITYAVYSVVITPAPRLIGGGGLAAQGSPGAAGAAAEQTVVPNGSATGPGAGATGAGQAAGAAARGGRSAAGGGTAAAGTISADEANLPAAARLYSGADDRIGISDTAITLCGHAALTFGPAFNIGKSDINVFWQNLNDHGGIYGRKFKVDWQDDSYQPGPAVTAAQTCKDQGTFILLGGIGFDQIPAVRVWAEQNHELYLHHVAVQRGSEGLRYSFTALPSVEQMGRTFGQLAVQKYRGKKIGVLWRNSSNWQPGRDEFERVVKAAGMQIVGDYPVQNNQGNYTQQIVELKTAGAEVVFAWENALAATEMVRQAKSQSYSPHWLLFPFNLTLQTIGNDALNPPLDGLAAWPAYTANNHDGPYASYASDLAEFEREYKQYDPNANLSGPGGDLLFLAWVGFKQLADMFQDCGPDCTRNKFAALILSGYHKTVTPNCDADFSGGDHHHAAPRMDVFTTTAGPGGSPMWVPTQRCLSSLGP